MKRLALALLALAAIVLPAPRSFAAPSTYTYDSLNRLTSATINGSRIEYQYDSAGNITSVKTPYAIAIARNGTGTGTITDNRGKINCGTDCSGVYDLNTVVAVTATPEPGMAFDGWSGACSGTGTCVVTTDGVKSVTASFSVLPSSSALSVADAEGVEGDSGHADIVFPVTLDPVSPTTVTVDWTTVDGSAVAPADYTAAGGTVTFAPGASLGTIVVQAAGDALDENDETFAIALSNPSNASIADGDATGTIRDDDEPPTLSIGDVTVVEGDADVAAGELLVGVSTASGRTISIDWTTTADGSASSGTDFLPAAGTLTFDPGETTKGVTVGVIGDQLIEPDETFSVLLTSPVNASIIDPKGVVTITNDDAGRRVRGDFNGDRRTDITWRNQKTYETHAWMMNGTSIAAGGVMVSAGAEWKRMGVADLDGNGKADLIWRHASGEAHAWFMDGTALVAGAVLPYISAEWLLGGIGDFDGDGRDDLIWTHVTTGETHLWTMNAGQIATAGVLPVNTTRWAIAATGDIDGDGRDDLVLRNKSTGEAHVWFMNGPSIVGGAVLPFVDVDWTLETAADFDADRNVDLMWRRTATGETHIWFMNGATVTRAAASTAPAPPWVLTDVGDYDGDGQSDLVWRHPTSGEAHMWLMNGVVIRSGAVLPGISVDWTTIREGD